VIACRRAEDGVERVPLGVDRHVEAPVIHAGAVLPTVFGPCFISSFSSLRDGMKLPDLFAAARVIGTSVSRLTCGGLFWNVGAHKQQVLINGRRRIVRNDKIDFTLVAETENRLTRRGVECDEPAPRGDEDAGGNVGFAWPVGDSAVRE